MTQEFTSGAVSPPIGFIQAGPWTECDDQGPDDELCGILFEQLEYLIQYSHEERDRFERVRAILMEAFQ